MTTEGEDLISSSLNEIYSTTTSETPVLLLDGYDLPVFGLDNGEFYSLHFTALVCIVSSLVCASLSIIFSFRNQSARDFFNKWSKSDRFVVYMATCDALFNASHVLDHAHIVITKDHVRPKELCEFYAFNIAVFITAQMLLVNVVALNAFMLMYFNVNLNFGHYDWKLLLWTFGAPFAGSIVAVVAKQFGPSGFYCYFDGVRGIAVLWFTTLPLLVIVAINIVLYALTWRRIHEQTKLIGRTVGPNTQSAKASSKTAKTMSLFVAAFFIQWTPLGVYSACALLTTSVPMVIFYIVVLFSNIGGCLNLAVFVFIRRSRRHHQSENDTSTTQMKSIS